MTSLLVIACYIFFLQSYKNAIHYNKKGTRNISSPNFGFHATLKKWKHLLKVCFQCIKVLLTEQKEPM